MKHLSTLFIIIVSAVWAWSSNAYALTANSVSEAISACQARSSQHIYGTHPDSCEVTPATWEGYWTVTAYECPDPECSFRMKDAEWEDIYDPTYEQPPECTAPNYIDVVSGECVPPEETCFTTIDTMSEECVYIGPDDPNDELPNGCVLDSKGNQICLSEEPGCYVANGKTICPTPDMVCGEKNGAFSCVSPEEEGCGYFNGERICFAPDGEKVDPTSPDHPDNGGNLDGDPTNDVTDSRPPEEGGDLNNQPNAPIDTQDSDRASEQTLRDVRENTKNSADALDEINDKLGQQKLDNQEQIDNQVQSASDQAITNTGVDQHIDGIGDAEITGDMVGDSGTTLLGLLPEQGACTDISVDMWNGHYFELSCADTQRLRDLLSWIFYVLTVWYLFNLLTTPPTQGLGR